MESHVPIKPLLKQVSYIILGAFCLLPWVSSGHALLIGMGISLILGNPFQQFTKNFTPRLLQLSIIGLGAGMNLTVVGKVGAEGVVYTAVGIILTLIFGVLIGRFLRVEKDTSLLVAVGTAICGGSAIAAVASTIKAKSHEVSVALATVFFLNAAALFIFPKTGHFFNLSEIQFGIWSALAIHDTSSVVGSAIQYGQSAVEIATTVKLARALWIIPVSIIIGAIWIKKEGAASTRKYPWFILGYLGAAALVTYFPQLGPVGLIVNSLAKRSLVLTLFLIGSGISRETIKTVGFRPFVQGVMLWVLVGSATLLAILEGWIHT